MERSLRCCSLGAGVGANTKLDAEARSGAGARFASGDLDAPTRLHATRFGFAILVVGIWMGVGAAAIALVSLTIALLPIVHDRIHRGHYPLC